MLEHSNVLFYKYFQHNSLKQKQTFGAGNISLIILNPALYNNHSFELSLLRFYRELDKTISLYTNTVHKDVLHKYSSTYYKTGLIECTHFLSQLADQQIALFQILGQRHFQLCIFQSSVSQILYPRLETQLDVQAPHLKL